jgi:hypothetical protein
MYYALPLINFISATVMLDLFFSLISQVLHPHNKAGNAKVLLIFNVVCFWTCENFKVLLIIPVNWRDVDNLTVIFFHNMSVERNYNSETVILREENSKNNIRAHKRKSNMEN